MDLLDLAILVLRIALVAVLYGFLVIVLRASASSLWKARPSTQPTSPGVGLRLIVLEAGGSGLAAGQVIEPGDGAVLGRAERADVVVGDASVSAAHARVRRIGRDWAVLDLGSTNGTLVNGAPVNAQTRLQQGDVLTLGSVRLNVDLAPG